MFDFENLEVYQISKNFNKEILNFLKEPNRIDSFLMDQLKRASISIVLNIAEGSGKFSKPDKRYFYTTSRASSYECVAIMEILRAENMLTPEEFSYFYKKLETISKMLLGLINSQK